mgnify:CR=1 FL=1
MKIIIPFIVTIHLDAMDALEIPLKLILKGYLFYFKKV